MAEKGLVHIYCGDGKGKTTAALGLGLRASGRGLKVLLVQFLKSGDTGELEGIKNLPGFTVLRGKAGTGFSFAMTDAEKEGTIRMHHQHLQAAIAQCAEGRWDMLILDEAVGAMNKGMLDKGMLLEFIRNKPFKLELVLTGRNPDQDLLELADYVSDIQKVKHPYDAGVGARPGIER